MKSTNLLVFALGASVGAAVAQPGNDPSDVFRLSVGPYDSKLDGKHTHDSKRAVEFLKLNELFEPGMTDKATAVIGYRGKRLGLTTAAEPRRMHIEGVERDQGTSRAWGMSAGVQGGPVTFRIAHQNRNVAKVAPSMPLGQRIDAKNSIIAANIDVGPLKAYTAYSASRGWGSSPLWNPDNPYGAAMITTPSTNSRDRLMGLSMPMGSTTLLASFIRKNDRDLANFDAQQIAIGATYTMSRKLDFYAAVSQTQLRNKLSPGVSSGALDGSAAVNVGMRHSF